MRNEGHVNPVFRWIGDKYNGIDLLINIVNLMNPGLILSQNNTRILRKNMETNIIGLCWVQREAAKLMAMRSEERKNIGHIVNVTSGVGQKIDMFWHDEFQNAHNGLYPASK